MTRVRVTWTEEVRQTAVLDFDDDLDLAILQMPGDIAVDIDAMLADADNEEYAVTDRQIESWEVVE